MTTPKFYLWKTAKFYPELENWLKFTAEYFHEYEGIDNTADKLLDELSEAKKEMTRKEKINGQENVYSQNQEKQRINDDQQ